MLSDGLSVTEHIIFVSRVWIYFDLQIEFLYFLSKVLMLSPGLPIKESSKYAQKSLGFSWCSNFHFVWLREQNERIDNENKENKEKMKV